MQDVIFVAVMVVFFALSVLLVKACDHIVGRDVTVVATESPEPGGEPEPDAAVAA